MTTYQLRQRNDQSTVYENRTIVFMDILGFKRALEDETLAKNILDALALVEEKVHEFYSNEIFSQCFDIQLTAFSDSIIISCPCSETVLALIAALEMSQLLIERNFLCRGAISCGDLYHKNNIVFGQSLVNAYSLENKEAKYPRIILAPQVCELFNGNNSEGDFSNLLRTDKDGYQFINLLYQGRRKNNDIKKILSNLLTDQLQTYTDIRDIKIISKLKWLKSEYEI